MRLDFKAFSHLAEGKFWKRLWNQINEDHCWGMAAELSYYFLLAFFPFLIFVSLVIAFLPLQEEVLYVRPTPEGAVQSSGEFPEEELKALEPPREILRPAPPRQVVPSTRETRILEELNRFLPDTTQEQVSRIVRNFPRWHGTGLAFLWVLVALWAASLGLNGMVGVLNRAYRVKDERSYFRTRLLAILVTVAVSLFMIVAVVLLFFGDLFAEWLQNLAQGTDWLHWLLGWVTKTLRWILIFLIMNLGIQMVYYALPARRLPWRLLSPGSVFVATGWLLGSLAFRYYVNNFADYQRMYGSLGDLIVLMIWFYFSSLFLLIGGEMDSEIFRARRRRRKAQEAQVAEIRPVPEKTAAVPRDEILQPEERPH